MKFLKIFIVCLFLSGCLVGPNYQPPVISISDDWKGSSAECLLQDQEFIVDWWQEFQDPLLTKYIEMAALCNNNLLIAEANICQARAVRHVTASELFPQISADLNATRTYFSKNGPVFAITPGGQNTTATTGLPFQIQIPQIQNIYNALIDASWEIDFFGKRRRAVEAADANIGVAIESRNATLISVLAEVAINYMELRSNQERGILIGENIDLLEKNVTITRKQYEFGLNDLTSLERIQAELLQSLALLPNIVASIYQNIYALSILTGNLPETLLDELLLQNPLPNLPNTVAVGIRSDLLRRRPDVRQAERELAAATANIGVAVASFFPSFTLIGDIGFQSLSLSNLFQAKSLTWALEGDINMPIFQGGRLVGNLRVSEAVAAASAFQYQQTVLSAIQEAETRIAFYCEDLHTRKILRDTVEKYTALVSLSQQRYAKGLVDLTELLDIERQWNTAQQNLLTSETAALVDLITLYKALGGGWEPCF